MQIAQARDGSSLEPVFICDIQLKNAGPLLRFSTRQITVGGYLYEPYIEAISGLSDEINRIDSSFLNAAIQIVFKNLPFKTYDFLIEIADTYPFTGAQITVKEVYLSNGSPTSDTATLFLGNLDEPREIDIAAFKCNVSTRAFYLDQTWNQAFVTLANWPNAWEDVGKVEPFHYGSSVRVPALRTDWGVRTTLVADIDDTQTTGITVSDPDSRMPASGTVIVDDEEIAYTGIASKTLSGVTRGANSTTKTAHSAGATAWEKKAQYDSLLAGHECSAVGDIYAEIAGELLRVTSGVSAVLSGGKQLLRATGQVGVAPVKDGIGVNDGITVGDNIAAATTDTTSIEKDDTFSSPLHMYVHTGAYDIVTKNITFPAAPSGTLSDISIEYSFFLTDVTLPTDGSYYVIQIDGVQVIRIDSTGVHWSLSSPYRKGRASWATTVYLTFSGTAGGTGRWDFYLQSGIERCTRVIAISKTGSASRAGSVTKTGGLIATRKVDRFHAVVSGYKDPDGNYGGIGTLIERPDRVIKHFLIQKAGYTLAEIDQPSFDAAGALCAAAIAGGYKFAFSIQDKIVPSESARQMAAECRSALRYIAGKWYLDYIPDAAPAVAATIDEGDVEGENGKFTFNDMPITDIRNDLTARFGRDYSPMGSSSEWTGTSAASDASSIAIHGTRHLDIDFEFIRSQTMADHVLAHMLLERKLPLKLINAPVLWEFFGLIVGQTFGITGRLFNAKKFFIEKFSRDQGKGTLEGREWWS